MAKRGRKQLNAVAEWLGSRNPHTGAQVRGQVWRGPLPRRAEPVDWFAIDADTFEANKAIDEKRRPKLAFMPDSNLGRLLMNPKVKRPLRRLIIATVQAPPTARRDRNERAIRAQLAALGV